MVGFSIVSMHNFSWIRALTEKGTFETATLEHLGLILSQGIPKLLIRWSWVRIPPDPPSFFKSILRMPGLSRR